MSRSARKYLGGGLHVSASSVRVLQECPRQFYLQYIRGLPREGLPSRMVLGTAIHASLELFYRALMEGESEPGLEELVAAAVWSIRSAVSGPIPVEWEGEDGQAELEVECRRVLEAFLNAPYRPHKVLGVEVPFELSLQDEKAGVIYDEKVIGYFDLIVEDEDGSIVIVDHKVTSRLAVPKSTELDVQLGLYGWAGDQLSGKPVRLRHNVLVRGKKAVRLEVVDIPRSKNDAREAQDGLFSAMEYIHLAVEHPRPQLLLGRRRSWRCSGCGYRARCGQSGAETSMGEAGELVLKSAPGRVGGRIRGRRGASSAASGWRQHRLSH